MSAGLAGALLGSFGRDLAIVGERNARWLGVMGASAIDVVDAMRHVQGRDAPMVRIASDRTAPPRGRAALP